MVRSARRRFFEANERTADQPPGARDVKVVTTVIGPDQYRIVATATFESAPPEVGRFCGTGRPRRRGPAGLTSDFTWLSGGRIRSRQRFSSRWRAPSSKRDLRADGGGGSGSVSPPLSGSGTCTRVVEYDAVLELQGLPRRAQLLGEA